jgi:hypothetical protein
MKFLSKVNLRRIFSIGLLSITLFLGSAPVNLFAPFYSDVAMAEVSEDETLGIPGETVMKESAYESAKEDRNQRQAARSEQADNEDESKSIAEQLNIDEIKDTLTK